MSRRADAARWFCALVVLSWSCAVPAQSPPVIEFFNVELKHYFMTANAQEAAGIDQGAAGPGWSRTGRSFLSGGERAVCRFYGVPQRGGPNSHFYTADAAECLAVQQDPGWQLEGYDFYTSVPGSQGCSAGQLAVYRLYNNRAAAGDSNHRYTTDLALYEQMRQAGWAGEGVVMCAPAPTGSTGAAPRVFALMDRGASAASLLQYAQRSNVDGLAWRGSWSDLEPSAGRYEWQRLDAALDTARATGKGLTVHVMGSLGAAPTWLAGLGAQTYTYSAPYGSVTDPIPWDAVFLARYGQFVGEMAEHMAARGDAARVTAVSVTVPVPEMSLLGCRDGRLTGGTTYTRANYLQAWKSSVERMATAFPTQTVFISAPVATICQPDTDGRAFYTDVMDHALGLSAKAAIFAADLNAEGSQRLEQVADGVRARAAIAFQTIWSATNDPQGRMRGSLKTAVCKGLAAGAKYFEIYQADLDNADAAVQEAISLARGGPGGC